LTTGDWLSPSSARNYFAQDTLLDWLDLFGESRGFVRDDKRPGYAPNLDMGVFLREKGRSFEAAVLRVIKSRFDVVEVPFESDSRERAAQLTEQAIHDGAPLIYQGVLLDHTHNLYCRPDFIVRSDILALLSSECPLSDDELALPRHYRVMDSKFTTCELNRHGLLGTSGSDGYRAAQLLAYNRALAAVQGYFPPMAYILGRSCTQGRERSTSCLDRLAPADMEDADIAAKLDTAVAWLRRLRSEGNSWQLLPEPSVDELRPNMSNTQDSPWHAAKKEINEQLHDLTSLWQVSPIKRQLGLAHGVSRWDDPKCRAELFDLSVDRTRILQAVIESQGPNSPLVTPRHISGEREQWHEPGAIEFFVDFETVNDLDDDFSSMPQRGGQPLIFMIGCGYEDKGDWQFECFIADRLTQEAEAKTIEAWLNHMSRIAGQRGVESPLVFHWSPAETSSLSNAYNSARERHPSATWPEPNWYDFLGRVVRKEPVTTKGALAFGLKAIAKAMFAHGLIRTRWQDGPVDGLAAMIGAWRCEAEARETGVTLPNLPLMRSIADYNEVDCKVMWEIISYLRANH
jgi:hypothetical protein